MDTPLKHLETGEMISITAEWTNGAAFTAVPEIKPLRPKVEAAHAELVRARPAEAAATPANVAAISAELRGVDLRHDHALRAAIYLTLAAEEHALASDPPDEEQATAFADLRARLFPSGLGGTAATYLAEEGNAKQAQGVLDADPELKKLLGGLHLSKKETGLDVFASYAALAAQVGELERKKAEALSEAATQESPAGTLAAARNGWIRIVGTVLHVLEHAEGEVAAKLRDDVIAIATRAAKTAAAAAKAAKAKKAATEKP
jgi:hypothetical protein